MSDSLVRPDPALIQTAPHPLYPPEEVPSCDWHDAVGVFWQDEGIKKVHSQWVPCIRLYWQIAERRKSGRRFLVSKRFHKTLHRKALLRAWLERWQHRAFDPDEVRWGVSVDRFLTMPCRVKIDVTYEDDRAPWVDVLDLQPWDFTLRRRALTPEFLKPRRLGSPRDA